MIRGAIVMVLILAAYGFVMSVDAPTQHEEAQDVAADVVRAQVAARRKAREEQREQWLAAEMKRRGCLNAPR